MGINIDFGVKAAKQEVTAFEQQLSLIGHLLCGVV
jgi:hypothetical protein